MGEVCIAGDVAIPCLNNSVNNSYVSCACGHNIISYGDACVEDIVVVIACTLVGSADECYCGIQGDLFLSSDIECSEDPV